MLIVCVVFAGERKLRKCTYISLRSGLVQGHPFTIPTPPQPPKKGHTTVSVYLTEYTSRECASHERESHGWVFHGRASNRRASHGRAPHGCATL